MPVPFTAADAARLKETLESVVADGATPGGVIVYGTADGTPEFLSAGVVAPECGDEAPTRHTAYDIASLTKVVATWPLVGRAHHDGLLDLDEPVRDFLPAMNGETPTAEATVRQLLAHTSGLRASTRLDHYRGAELPLHELMCREPLDDAPGTHLHQLRVHPAGLGARAHQRPAPRPAGRSHVEEPRHARSDVRAPESLQPGRPDRAAHPRRPAHQGRRARRQRRPARRRRRPCRRLRHPAQPRPVRPAAADRVCRRDRRRPGRVDASQSRSPDRHRTRPGPRPVLDPRRRWTRRLPPRVHRDQPLPRPHTGRYLAICTNAVYHGNARTRIAPLRALALKTTSAT